MVKETGRIGEEVIIGDKNDVLQALQKCLVKVIQAVTVTNP